MSYLIGFAPWLAYFVIALGLNPSRDTMLLAAAVGLALSIAFLIPKVRSATVSALDVGALVFFPLMAALTFVLPVETLDKWGPVFGQLALTLSVAAGQIMHRPFTMAYAKPETPQALWDYPTFKASNMKISSMWLIAFGTMTILSIVAVPLDPTSIGAILLNWVAPVLLITGVVRWMTGFIARERTEGQARLDARLEVTIPPGGQVVGWLDHVTTTLPSARAEQLFQALQSLGLVIPWQYRQYAGFASGAVRLGNLNLEVIGTELPDFDPQMVTFEPVSLNGLSDELDRRGILHGDQLPTTANIQGQDRTIFTSMALPGVSSPGQLTTQFCVTLTPVRTWSTEAPANKAGIVKVHWVTMGVPPAAVPMWHALLGPSGGAQLTQGPIVEVHASSQVGVRSITVTTHDPKAAVAAFAQAGLPTSGWTATVGTLTLSFVIDH